MKLALITIALFALCAFLVEGKKGRVKCSAECWERLPKCKEECKRVNLAPRICNAQCQDKVTQCIRDECKVSEHVDTFEEHQKYD
ncbi:hypothetical protein EG68_05362 [Paragonimus skrjabini miyazakii]|uniref:Uncharacterized protein n=1 Tax=Paragonimus skrjabini miyazakii TaxID=59628 RepID=A0A8S9YRK2_9TREM|nr:hypothetical protein EG68_05362 [Paragonimus skrjabini miyazakii]